MVKKKEVKKEEDDLGILSMKGLFPEDMETTEIIGKVRREWVKI